MLLDNESLRVVDLVYCKQVHMTHQLDLIRPIREVCSVILVKRPLEYHSDDIAATILAFLIAQNLHKVEIHVLDCPFVTQTQGIIL